MCETEEQKDIMESCLNQISHLCNLISIAGCFNITNIETIQLLCEQGLKDT